MAHLRTRRHRIGQGNVEYMMYISVVVIALAVAAYAFVGPFSDGFDVMKQDTTAVFDNVTSSGSGEQR